MSDEERVATGKAKLPYHLFLGRSNNIRVLFATAAASFACEPAIKQRNELNFFFLLSSAVLSSFTTSKYWRMPTPRSATQQLSMPSSRLKRLLRTKSLHLPKPTTTTQMQTLTMVQQPLEGAEVALQLREVEEEGTMPVEVGEPILQQATTMEAVLGDKHTLSTPSKVFLPIRTDGRSKDALPTSPTSDTGPTLEEMESYSPSLC